MIISKRTHCHPETSSFNLKLFVKLQIFESRNRWDAHSVEDIIGRVELEALRLDFLPRRHSQRQGHITPSVVKDNRVATLKDSIIEWLFELTNTFFLYRKR